MFELRKLSRAGVDVALKKAERYRLLNEPYEAESICRDVLDVDPENHAARIGLILALTDQFSRDSHPGPADVRRLVDALEDPYEREYYAGIVCERQAKATLSRRSSPAAGYIAYDWFRRAMECYERAQASSPSGDDSALLRWNTCARLLNTNENLRPAPDEAQTMLE